MSKSLPQQRTPVFAVPANTPVPGNDEHPASAERFFCPECGAYVNGSEARHCGTRPERDVVSSKTAGKLGTGEFS